MNTQFVGLLLLVWASSTSAARGELADELANEFDAASNSAVAADLVAGAMFGGRFRLLSALWRQGLGPERSEHIPLPDTVSRDFPDASELFAGSFGEVWRAHDTARGVNVALKMFYSTARDGKRYFLTWQLATGNERLARNLNAAGEECTIARQLQGYATGNPAGASRLMQCYEDHVTSGVSPTGHTVGENDPLYLILEECGTLPIDLWLKKNKERWLQERKDLTDAQKERWPQEYVVRVLKLFRQFMEGLDYLTSHDKKWVHHDLKPANLVIKELPDGEEVLKIIDFGAMTRASDEASRRYVVSTVMYAPPEWFNFTGEFYHIQGYNNEHPASFDTYSAAAILSEMITGARMFMTLRSTAPSPDMEKKAACNKDRSCEMATVVAPVKAPGAEEYKLTKSWGHSNATDGVVRPWKELAPKFVPKMESLLFTPEVEADSLYGPAVEFYRMASERKEWYPTFMSMLAFDPEVRATPKEVLQSRLLSRIKSIVDPDFDAAAAARQNQA